MAGADLIKFAVKISISLLNNCMHGHRPHRLAHAPLRKTIVDNYNTRVDTVLVCFQHSTSYVNISGQSQKFIRETMWCIQFWRKRQKTELTFAVVISCMIIYFELAYHDTHMVDPSTYAC